MTKLINENMTKLTFVKFVYFSCFLLCNLVVFSFFKTTKITSYL